jgi:hypothetical protein
MKKVFFVASLSLIFLASCSKDYTCTCSTTVMGETVSSSTTVNGTKKDVKEACDAGDSSAGGITVDCEIQ